MSKSNAENSISIKELIEPSVLVGTDGPSRKLNCNYGNVKYIFADEMNMPVTKMFSSFGNKNYDLFVYMNKDYNFSTKDSLSKLVNHFWSNEFKHIGGMYSDISISLGKKRKMLKSYPAFNESLINTIINSPFIAKKEVAPIFNNEIEHLFLYDGLLNMLKKTRVFHAAHCFFTLEHFNLDSADINMELDVIDKSL